MGFKEFLIIGKTGESKIAKWIISNGGQVLPVYEISENQFKGPALYYEGGTLVAPDMLTFKKGELRWIEVKTKSSFSWHRNTERFVTGIDLHHYADYLKVKEITKTQLWLLFLQGQGVAKDTPEGKISPTGLFGGEISDLKQNENHRHGNYGKSGMVYWSHDVLTKFCELNEIDNMPKHNSKFNLAAIWDLMDINGFGNKSLNELTADQVTALGLFYLKSRL